MTSPTLKDRLIALAPGPNSVYIRRLGRVLPEIEDALNKGVSRQAIVKALQEDGIDVTLNGFAKALYRLRKKAREQATKQIATRPQIKASESAAGNPPTVEPVSDSNGRPFEPIDIRAIARHRPDLNELARLGREASKARDKAGKPCSIVAPPENER